MEIRMLPTQVCCCVMHFCCPVHLCSPTFVWAYLCLCCAIQVVAGVFVTGPRPLSQGPAAALARMSLLDTLDELVCGRQCLRISILVPAAARAASPARSDTTASSIACLTTMNKAPAPHRKPRR